MTKLFISEPGSSEYEVFVPAEDGPISFDWVSFSGNQSLSLKMKPATNEDFVADFSSPQGAQKEPDRETYETLVRTAVLEIQQKSLGKIVLSRPQTFGISPTPLSLFKALAAKYSKACVYLFSHPSAGVWMGASPELLLKKEDEQLLSMSLAGTRRKGDESSFSSKEAEEQELVTEFITEQFELQNELTQLEVSGPEIVSAGNLVHLQSLVKAKAGNGFDPNGLLAKLHPTPAVSGFPRQQALDFIDQYETYDRSFYAGYFGLRRPAGFSYYVNLRCMQLYKKAMTLYAGGGITRNSDATVEWEETEAKMRTLLDVIEA